MDDLLESEIVSDKVDKEEIVNPIVAKALSRQFEFVIDAGGGGGGGTWFKLVHLDRLLHTGSQKIIYIELTQDHS